MKAGLSRKLYDFAADCMDLAQEQGLDPAECVSGLITAIALISTAGTRPEADGKVLGVLMAGLQEEYALHVKHRRADA